MKCHVYKTVGRYSSWIDGYAIKVKGNILTADKKTYWFETDHYDKRGFPLNTSAESLKTAEKNLKAYLEGFDGESTIKVDNF